MESHNHQYPEDIKEDIIYLMSKYTITSMKKITEFTQPSFVSRIFEYKL